MKVLKGFVVLSYIFIISCTLGSNRDEENLTDPKENEDRLRLSKVYSPLAGLYHGQVSASQDQKQKYDVQLFLQVEQIPEGINEQGKIRLRPSLNARYRRLDVVMADVFLEVGFYPETGEIFLTNANRNNTSSPFSIKGNLRGKKIVGTLSRDGGVVGPIELVWKDQLPTAPFAGIEVEERERLLNTFSPIEGTYSGTLSSGGESEKSFPFDLTLFVVEVESGVNAQGEPKFTPMLRGRYRRTDFIDAQGDVLLKARYFHQTQKIVLSSADQSLTIEAIVDLSGEQKRLHKGRFVNPNGVWGTFAETTEYSSAASAPFDGMALEERSRLEALYKSIAGNYRGQIQPESGEPYTAEIQLQLAEIDNQGTVLPGLVAYYKRTDFFDDTIGARFLKVSYYPEQAKIVMAAGESNRGGGSSSVVGAGFFSVSGNLIDETLTAEVKDHRGVVGTFSAIKAESDE